MKSCLTLTFDFKVMHPAKRVALSRNQSLSALVEELLRTVSMADVGSAPEFEESLSRRWGGLLKLECKGDARFRNLAEKYDL